MSSTGISPIGHSYKANSVKYNKSSTWLTASRETARQHLDGLSLLENIYDEVSVIWTYHNFIIMLFLQVDKCVEYKNESTY